MRQIKSRLQHYLNPLHIYCRLKSFGLPTRTAIRMSAVYERFYRRLA
ncbi:MAG: hypothetical protein LBJ82_05725 [Deltaproteobacteria bacterium]|jgi:hypothetical protein|nr:hypothetical protein [Deltaproteobacteria bacterium]